MRVYIREQGKAESACCEHRDLHTSPKLLTRATLRPILLLLFLSKGQPANPIHNASTMPHSTRHTAIARPHIQTRIPREEISWSQQQRHRLCRHDRKVFWRREVRDAEGMPEYDVGIDEVGGRIGLNPCGYTLRGLARRLGDVSACGMDLGIVVWGKFSSG
jgi:hypothetical protein